MTLVDALAGVKRLYLDSAPVIYHVEAVLAYQAKMDKVFQEVVAGRLTAVTGPVTLAECLVQPFRDGDLSLVQKFEDVITNAANTEFISIDQSATKAAELRAKYQLALLDALQVATALAANCDALLTNDFGLKPVTEIPVLILDELTI